MGGPGFEGLGRTLLIVGGIIFALGLLLTLAPRLPFLGRLPGDIHIEGKRFSFSFPLMTSLLLSVVLTIVLNVIARLFR